ncbi:MAG: hypothetical protein P1S60_11070 [Anaerolineae bacterium]|nr:hypothetical protein [Anaerolineae bacterium]
MHKYTLSVRSGHLYLNNTPFLVKGLRCSNALVTNHAAEQLVRHLPVFAAYGVNTISVFLMGSRFGDVKGYLQDGTLNPFYLSRLHSILQEAHDRGMVVLVGCLYWGNSKAIYEDWTQMQANIAIAQTVRWLAEHNFNNVMVDVDNEGMALRNMGFDNQELVRAGKKANSSIVIGTNFRGDPPPEADVALHFSNPAPGKPYVESEGSPDNTPGGYWGVYSKLDGLYGYRNIGVYTEAMKAHQIAVTRQHLDSGKGYLLASTWLQAPPPQGPKHFPGGNGSIDDPVVRWWLEFIRHTYGVYQP